MHSLTHMQLLYSARCCVCRKHNNADFYLDFQPAIAFFRRKKRAAQVGREAGLCCTGWGPGQATRPLCLARSYFDMLICKA